MIKQVCTIFLALHLINLGAQEVPGAIKKNSFQLDVGMIQLKDKNLHEKVHTGQLYGLDYGHLKQVRNSSNFDISLRYSRLKTKFEELSASANVLLSGGYFFLFEIVKNERFTYLIGPEVKLNYDLSFYPNWDESHLYWASSIDLGVRNRFSLHICEKQSLVLDLGLSLFSVFSRPDLDRQYKIDDISLSGIVENLHSNLEAGTINKSLTASFQTEYQFYSSEKITQSICYSFNYKNMKSNDGLAFQESIHKIGFKIYF